MGTGRGASSRLVPPEPARGGGPVAGVGVHFPDAPAAPDRCRGPAKGIRGVPAEPPGASGRGAFLPVPLSLLSPRPIRSRRRTHGDRGRERLAAERRRGRRRRRRGGRRGRVPSGHDDERPGKGSHHRRYAGRRQPCKAAELLASASARSTASSKNTRSRSDGAGTRRRDRCTHAGRRPHVGRSARHTTSRARAGHPRAPAAHVPFPLTAESVGSVTSRWIPRPYRATGELRSTPVEDVNGALRFPLRQALATPFRSDRENRTGRSSGALRLEVFRLEGRQAAR